jgi:hypothetical protein
MASQESHRTSSEALDELHCRRIIPYLRVMGFTLIEPLLYPGRTLVHYSALNLVWPLSRGVLDAVGA